MNSLSYLNKIFSNELFEKIRSIRILVVGAGGIGCELIKDLVLCGFCNITIIDMDAVDMSNLNRQFFFRRRHLGMPKSTVVALEATKLLERFNCSNSSDWKINGIVGNIMDYDSDFFNKFDFVLNALDNISARKYVNKICIAFNIELIDSGSAGYNGQVHPIIPRISRCYECYPPPVQKTFPICTIRSTPDKPQHCIAWSKYLFELVFGTRQTSIEKSENLLSDIANNVQFDLDLLKNSNFDDLHEIMDRYIKDMFNFLFFTEINQLSKNKEIYNENNKKYLIAITWDEVQANPSSFSENSQANEVSEDQKVLTVKEYANMFYKSVYEIFRERKDQIGNSIFFDKDDKNTMDFICASSNLRSYNFHIPLQSRWKCQSIAGSIIPAVASTNAIVSGAQVIQLLLLLKSKLVNSNNIKEENKEKNQSNSELRTVKYVWIKNTPMGRFLICPEPLEKCNPKCLICSQQLIKITISSLERWSLIDFVQDIICKYLNLSEPSIEINGKCIWDPDLLSEDHFLKIGSQKTLSEWKFKDGCIISITDFSKGEFQCDALINLEHNIETKTKGDYCLNEKNGEKFIFEIQSNNSNEDMNKDSNLKENSEDDILYEVKHDEIENSKSNKRKNSVKESPMEDNKLSIVAKKNKNV